MRSTFIALLLSGYPAAFPVRAQTTYLIVRHFDRLTVYNKYQQIASRPELEQLKSLRPVEVVKEDDRLGGGIIPCMAIQTAGRTFYLARDEDGSLSASGDAGVVGLYHAATPLLDTVVVLVNNRIRISPAIGGSGSKLSAGQLLFRFFQQKGRAYCQVVGGSPEFGWIAFRDYIEGKEWRRPERPVASGGPLPERTLRRIEERVRETNETLAGLYAYFNERTNEENAAPLWEFAVTSDSITIRLTGEETTDAHKESSLYLAKDVENMVLGTGWEVLRGPGRILVRRR